MGCTLLNAIISHFFAVVELRISEEVQDYHNKKETFQKTQRSWLTIACHTLGESWWHWLSFVRRDFIL